MIDNSALTAVVAGVMSGGLFTSGVAVYKARKTAPAERDSLIVQGAETAVMTLERSLAAETKRADRAERQVAERDKQLERLQLRLESMQETLDEVRRELHDLLTTK